DRGGIPGAGGNHGPAHQPGQAHRLWRAAGRAGRPRHRPAGAVPGLQRGVQRRGRPRRGGDPADPAGRDPDGVRGGVRPALAVAVGEADGPPAGLAALEQVAHGVPRRTAAEAYLRERAGDLPLAARLYADAAHAATNLAERDYLTRQAARLNDMLRG